ncbi:hypothetical protein EV421DRAFT_1743038 [Armillaria borealis]|uniref:Uncharacterized protein n=1 Tax=Armillaria borealis TaxID=47425 RepID=A0AA39MFE9_9AGAR|nr:hypothetical protein EV421DRAFT_1743038 [Armillaria borealis]
MIISQQDTRRVLAFSPSSVLWLFLALLAVVLTLVYPSMRNALSRPSFRLDGYGVGLRVSENVQAKNFPAAARVQLLTLPSPPLFGQRQRRLRPSLPLDRYYVRTPPSTPVTVPQSLAIKSSTFKIRQSRPQNFPTASTTQRLQHILHRPFLVNGTIQVTISQNFDRLILPIFSAV